MEKRVDIIRNFVIIDGIILYRAISQNCSGCYFNKNKSPFYGIGCDIRVNITYITGSMTLPICYPINELHVNRLYSSDDGLTYAFRYHTPSMSYIEWYNRFHIITKATKEGISLFISLVISIRLNLYE